jgi:hypothetical protein
MTGIDPVTIRARWIALRFTHAAEPRTPPAALLILLCLQAAASMLAVRRDPVDRFRAVVVSGLVWESLRRLDRLPPPRLTRAR